MIVANQKMYNLSTDKCPIICDANIGCGGITVKNKIYGRTYTAYDGTEGASHGKLFCIEP